MSGPSRQSASEPSAPRIAAELGAGLRPGLGLLVLEQVDSTNRVGRSLAERFNLESTAVVILALEQQSGRGRGDRAWASSPRAGAWLTWAGAVDAGRLPTLPSRIGVSLCRRLDRMGAAGVGLKWPNDLVFDRRKLGGILCRSFVRGERTLAVCGVGVNIRNPGGDLERTAVGLRELGIESDLVNIAGECIRALDAAAVGETSQDAETWRDLLDRYSVHRPGDQIAWHAATGGATTAGERRRGTFRGFDAAGRMRVEIEGREEIVASGEID